MKSYAKVITKNKELHYTIKSYDSDERITLSNTYCERDLGVLISNDLKPSNQVNKGAAKANSILGLLKSPSLNRDVITWKKFYTSYVRPFIEFAVTSWSRYNIKDIDPA